jgi:hypothetical protein
MVISDSNPYTKYNSFGLVMGLCVYERCNSTTSDSLGTITQGAYAEFIDPAINSTLNLQSNTTNLLRPPSTDKPLVTFFYP